MRIQNLILSTRDKTQKFGFTLIEAVVLLFIFSVIVLTFYSVFTTGVKYIEEAKTRLGAVALANEKMEIVRNLDYSAVGTTANPPYGNLLAKEVVTVNTRTYYVFTDVRYKDDLFDGTLGGSPNDAIPNDYKQVRIKVAWEDDIATSKAVTLVSNSVPPGMEQSAGGGTLSINVLDNTGIGIPQATVHIKNDTGTVDTITTTDNSGNISLVAMPVGNQNYSLEVSKSGYYPVKTYAPYPASTFDPIDVHASVVADSLNAKSIITDKLSKVNIFTKDHFGNVIPNIGFNLKGGKQTGNTVVVPPQSPDPVFDYDNNLNSGSGGKKEINNLSFGVYYFEFLNPTSNYEFIKVDNNQDKNDKFDLAPGIESDVTAILADKNINSLLVTVSDNADNSLIEGASVRLQNASLGYDATIVTDRYGQAYFPVALPQLTAGQYDLTVSASGFQTSSSIVAISNLTASSVGLTSN